MIRCVKALHEEGIIHRDIKPANFCMGGTKQTENTLYMVDFGVAKKFKSSDGKHIPYRDDKSKVTGTHRYCSLNTHYGVEQSRRDDLETIGHTLIHLLRGKLPW